MMAVARPLPMIGPSGPAGREPAPGDDGDLAGQPLGLRQARIARERLGVGLARGHRSDTSIAVMRLVAASEPPRPPEGYPATGPPVPWYRVAT